MEYLVKLEKLGLYHDETIEIYNNGENLYDILIIENDNYKIVKCIYKKTEITIDDIKNLLFIAYTNNCDSEIMLITTTDLCKYIKNIFNKEYIKEKTVNKINNKIQ